MKPTTIIIPDKTVEDAEQIMLEEGIKDCKVIEVDEGIKLIDIEYV